MSAQHPVTFSITRELWGKTPAEIEEEKGIPEPPREVTVTAFEAVVYTIDTLQIAKPK